jgi:flagellar motor switch/type III secretory pathway protein FliN
MRFLTRSREATRVGARHVRSMRFEDRSLLAVSAGCVVANGFRESLSQLLGVPVVTRLFEPALPDPNGWAAIANGARSYLVRGSRSDGAIVVRETDALRLAGAAFGVAESGTRSLSGIETTVFERMIAAFATQLGAVCGNTERPRLIGTLAGFTTYLEVHIAEPVCARIGVALSREPVEAQSPGLNLADLRAVELDIAVQLGGCRVEAAKLADLEVGSLIPLGPVTAMAGIAYLAGRALGRGECGVVSGRYALSIGTGINEGSDEPSL